MAIDFDAGVARFALDLAQSLALVVLWLRKPGQDAATAVNTLRAHVDDLASDLRDRQALIEERIAHMPSDAELAKLEGAMKVIDARTLGMADNVVTLRGQMNRLEDYIHSLTTK